MVTPVDVPGEFGSVVNRVIRFTRIVGVYEGWTGLIANAALAPVGVLFPVAVAPSLTVAFAAVYLGLGLRRANFLLAYPCLLLLPVVTLVSLLVTEFEWGGRRYRFAGDGDVVVLGRAGRNGGGGGDES
jgi:hypothetical protein